MKTDGDEAYAGEAGSKTGVKVFVVTVPPLTKEVRVRVKGVWAKAGEAKARRATRATRRLRNMALTEQRPPWGMGGIGREARGGRGAAVDGYRMGMVEGEWRISVGCDALICSGAL